MKLSKKPGSCNEIREIGRARDTLKRFRELTDALGAFDIQGACTIALGDVMAAEVEGWSRSSTWVELTIDVFDYVNRFASGRTGMPDGSEVFLRVYPIPSDPDQGEEYRAIVADGVWEVEIAIDIDASSTRVITLFRDQAVNRFHYWPDG